MTMGRKETLVVCQLFSSFLSVSFFSLLFFFSFFYSFLILFLLPHAKQGRAVPVSQIAVSEDLTHMAVGLYDGTGEQASNKTTEPARDRGRRREGEGEREGGGGGGGREEKKKKGEGGGGGGGGEEKKKKRERERKGGGEGGREREQEESREQEERGFVLPRPFVVFLPPSTFPSSSS